MKPPKGNRSSRPTYTFSGHLADNLTGDVVRVEYTTPYRSGLPVKQIGETHFASDNPPRSGSPNSD